MAKNVVELATSTPTFGILRGMLEFSLNFNGYLIFLDRTDRKLIRPSVGSLPSNCKTNVFLSMKKQPTAHLSLAQQSTPFRFVSHLHQSNTNLKNFG